MAIRVAEVLGIVLAGAGSLVVFATYMRRRKLPHPPEVSIDTDRRAFLSRVTLGSLAIFTVALGGGTVGSLWPTFRRGFGSKIVAGKVDDLLQTIERTGEPVYNIEGRFYVVPYDTTDARNQYVRDGVARNGLMAIYQKCSHLGCRVPFCATSKWFECPCHGARFNFAGEVKNGPAPAGLWRFPVEVDRNGYLVVDTKRAVAQPPSGVDTINQQPAGAFCTSC